MDISYCNICIFCIEKRFLASIPYSNHLIIFTHGFQIIFGRNLAHTYDRLRYSPEIPIAKYGQVIFCLNLLIADNQ